MQKKEKKREPNVEAGRKKERAGIRRWGIKFFETYRTQRAIVLMAESRHPAQGGPRIRPEKKKTALHSSANHFATLYAARGAPTAV